MLAEGVMPLPQHAQISADGPLMDPDLSKRRLMILAQVAERLLRADDAGKMVDELFELIRSELRLDVFFNYRLDDDHLFLEAHGGLSEEQATAGQVLGLGEAVCGCAARDRQRFHVKGVQASVDPLHAFVKQVGLDAYACTPLLHGDELIGTLGFGRRWADHFSDDELSFLHTLCEFVALAKYRLRVETELRAGIEQRERLLAELNHRVRNALQLAVSVVRLEAAADTTEEGSLALGRAAGRIEVIASAHRPIYASDNLKMVKVGQLLEAVGDGFDGAKVALEGVPLATLPIEQGVALGLLLHTLLADAESNGEPSTVRVIGGEGPVPPRIIVDGLINPTETLHTRLSRALLRQLGGNAASTEQGAIITLPLSDE